MNFKLKFSTKRPISYLTTAVPCSTERIFSFFLPNFHAFWPKIEPQVFLYLEFFVLNFSKSTRELRTKRLKCIVKLTQVEILDSVNY